MLFNSYVFILAFLPVTLIGYYVLNYFRKYRLATVWLCLASLFFYGFFNWSYLLIMLFSIVFNFTLSKWLKPKNAVGGGAASKSLRRSLLLLGLAINIGVLFWFKYFDFFVININAAFGSNFNLLHLILPLGISFFTFQQLSFVIDSYSGKTPDYPFLDYALFVTFFPQLIAGPIVLHSEIVPQFMDTEKRRFNSNSFAKGLMAFSFGLAKKVLIADTFAKAVTAGFADIPSLGTINAGIVMLSYTFQIYFDFSGYCDMATGIGKMFNIDIPMNFNSPYRALTIADFWDRWHITLTRFFTTYVYIPLGGSRKGNVRTCINVMIVFLISGLWHGANWTFILWGVLHGVASVINRMLKKPIAKCPKILTWVLTFVFINLTWVIFRADSISQAAQFFKQLFSMNITSVLPEIKQAFSWAEFNLLPSIIRSFIWVVFLAFGLFASIYMKNTNERLEIFKPSVRSLLVGTVLTAWSVLSLTGVSVFLYWNF